jgi:F0F1-type ATP synthase assembly protein I
MGAATALGVGLGWWLDERFGCSPWGVLGGGMLGMAVGLYSLLRELR